MELYHLPHIKDTIRYEIEILFGKLKIGLDDIPPSDLLKSWKVYTGPGPVLDFDFPAEEVRQKFYVQYVHINPTIPLFNQQPNLKKAVYIAINRAIQDIIGPVVERSVMISSITSRELVLKDFAMEPDEAKMLRAAFCMAQNLAGSLASVTSKDPSCASIVNNLRVALGAAPGKPVPSPIEHAIYTIVSDNLDLACSVVQKAAAEAAIRPTEEHLSAAVSDRKNHKKLMGGKGRPYYDINFVGSTGYAVASTLPELLRPKMGGVTPQQLQAYEDFLSTPSTSNNGFNTTSAAPTVPSRPMSPKHPISGKGGPTQDRRSQLPQQPQIASPHPTNEPFSLKEHATTIIDQLVVELNGALLALPGVRSLSELAPDHMVVRILSRFSGIIAATENRKEVALYAIQLVFPKLFDRSFLIREVFLTFVDAVVNVCPEVRNKIAEFLISSDTPQQFHREVVPALLHYHLLNISTYDTHLAKLLSGRDSLAIEFALYLVHNMIKSNVIRPNELRKSLEELSKIHSSDRELLSLLESIQASPLTSTRRSSSNDYKYYVESISSQLRENVKTLFDEWLSICVQPSADNAYPPFVQQLQKLGFFGSKDPPNETEIAFYQVSIETAFSMCTDHKNSGENEKEPVDISEFDCKPIIALGKLFSLLVKCFPDHILVLNRILRVIGEILKKNYDEHFDQRPYHKLLLTILAEINMPDPIFESQSLPLLLEFATFFLEFRPSSYPGFTFSWLEIISHRSFMPKLLKEHAGWSPMQKLLVELLKFLEPFLKDVHLTPPIKLLYQGTLRVLLILLHDFPEFLCDYHFSFCDVIPETCIQMRNLVLSAFPRTMKLPDPFTPNLKVDLLPEIKEPPRIRSPYIDGLVKSDLKKKLDIFLQTSGPETFLPELLNAVVKKQSKSGEREYNIPLINSLVISIGTRALSDSASQPGEFSPQAPMKLFRYLALNLDTKGRYFLFNAITNQLRYPNNHTHYFSCVLLFLFAESHEEIVQEQITRVLVERLIVHRPHPWGLLITFIELIKNPRYNFWSRAFTHCAPEIERLFFQVGSHIAQHRSE
jgi:CCR4-NOT transcription complex subunit 1